MADIELGYKNYSNQTLQWLPSDTEELFDKNKPKGWTKDSIEYKFNQYGFRCDEFDKNNGVMFLGCSYTIGIGINLKDSFTQVVADYLKLKNINLGIGGASNDTLFKVANYWVEELKPKVVVCLFTHIARTDTHLNNESHKQWILNPKNQIINFTKNRLAIEQICVKSNIQCYTYTLGDWAWERGTLLAPWSLERDRLDLARDQLHHGPMTNKRFSEIVIKDIKWLNK